MIRTNGCTLCKCAADANTNEGKAPRKYFQPYFSTEKTHMAGTLGKIKKNHCKNCECCPVSLFIVR